MNLEQQIDASFQALNSRDAGQVAKLFAAEGIYEDPVTRIPVHPYDLGTVMESIAAVYPDFQFETTTKTVTDKRGVAEWVLTGKNTKPLKAGIDATGKALHLKGVEIFEGERGFTRVTRYFDQKSLFEQIGMQVIIEPYHQGKATYGYSKRVASGNPSIPAIFGMTWIRFRDQSELDHIRTHSTRIIQDFLEEPGFISIVTGAAGDRAFTVTAWEDEESLYRALNKGHSHAKHDFRTGDISPGVWTSVWKPHHINRIWIRCPTCSQPNDVTDNRRDCAHCGVGLPERPSFW